MSDVKFSEEFKKTLCIFDRALVEFLETYPEFLELERKRIEK
jgi:hypothetical protein